MLWYHAAGIPYGEAHSSTAFLPRVIVLTTHASLPTEQAHASLIVVPRVCINKMIVVLTWFWAICVPLVGHYPHSVNTDRSFNDVLKRQVVAQFGVLLIQTYPAFYENQEIIYFNDFLRLKKKMLVIRLHVFFRRSSVFKNLQFYSSNIIEILK